MTHLPAQTAVQQGSYIRVYGNMRVFDSKRSLNAYVIKPIHDLNEVGLEPGVGGVCTGEGGWAEVWVLSLRFGDQVV